MKNRAVGLTTLAIFVCTIVESVLVVVMCACVSGEVLRQCSAANPADIYVPSVCSLQRSFMYAELAGATCTCVLMSFLTDHVR